MTILSRLRMNSLTRFCRPPSAIPNPYSCTSSAEKTRAALALIKRERSPDRILEICRSVYLNPQWHGDRVAYSVAISKLCESRNFDAIREFLEESKARPDLRNERYMCHLMVMYGKAGMVQEAINTFKQMGEEVGIERTAVSLNYLLYACNFANDIEELKRIYIDFPKLYNIKPNVETYNYMIRALSHTGSATSAYAVVAQMEKAHVKPKGTTFMEMLVGFYREEKFEEVDKVLQLVDYYGLRRGLGVFNVRIKSLCKLNKSGEAKQLLTQMMTKGVNPSSTTYGHLILGFCKEGKFNEAKKLFKAMAKRWCSPDAESYFTMISYLCVDAKDFEGALSFSKESIAKGWIPNFKTMKLLVQGLVSIDKVAEARELIRKVKERVPEDVRRWERVEASLPQ